MQNHQACTRHAPFETSTERFDLPPSDSPPGPQVLSSAAVLQGQKSVTIAHQGEMYRLQVTKLGKLILTK